MAIPYEPLVSEDFNRGYGPVQVTMPAGGSAVGHKVGIHTFLEKAFNPYDFGAVGDGGADDTAALQAAIDATPSQGGAIILPPNGIFKHHGLVLEDKEDFVIHGFGSQLHIVGAGSQPQGYIGIRLGGTLTRLVLDRLTIKGDGASASSHAGFWVKTGAVLTDLQVNGCKITDVAMAIAISNATASSTVGARILNNYIENVVGETTGYGYGIQCGTGAAAAANAVIAHNTIIRAQRHSVYVSNGGGIVVDSNTIKEHRYGASAPSGPRSAIVVARSENVVVSNNLIDTPKDCAVEVAPGALGFQPARNIVVSNNVIVNPVGTQPTMSIGSLTPAADETTDGVIISGNAFYQSATNQTQIEVFTGKRISIHGNQHYLLDVTAGVPALLIRGLGETAGTATYSDDIEVHDNVVYGTDGGGGAATAVEFDADAAASAIRATFVNNRYNTTSPAFAFDGPQTNPNIRVFNTPTRGLDQTLLAGLDGPLVLEGRAASNLNTGARIRYGSNDDYAAFVNFQGLQLGNTQENWLVAGRTAVGGLWKIVVNNTADLGEGTAFSGHDGIVAALIDSAGKWSVGPGSAAPDSTFSVKDATASTGVTRHVVIAGAGQGTTSLVEVRNNANVNQGGFAYDGTLYTKAVTFASLPTGVEGMIRAISDSNTAVWGANITGTGGNHVLAYYNGTNWTVIGK